MRRYWIAGVLLAIASSSIGQTEHVVLVSIDGFSAYSLDDDSIELPNLRKLIASGVRADSSETVFPSVTHPSHTTLVTGVLPRVHGVIGNRMVNRETGERFHITNRRHEDSVRVPTLFDAAKQKGLVTASFYWPENRDDPAVDFNIPEVFDGDTADPTVADPAFLDELRRADVPIDLYYRWYLDLGRKGVADAILADAAAYVLREYKPHLTAVHFLVADELQHEYGSDHYRAKEALTAADHALGILMTVVEEAGLEDKTAFFVVSDHGFHTVRHDVNLYPLFDEAGLSERVALHRSGWLLYVEAKDLDRDEAAIERVFERALALPGVARVLRPADFHDLGFPRYEEDPHVRGQYAIVGDIDTFLTADPKRTSTARRERAEPSHEHGYLPSHPRMYPIFVASGAGIRRGVRVGHVRNVDVAPTIARLLGLDLPTATGAVLEEVLSDGRIEDVATAYLQVIQNQEWDRMATFLTPESHYQDFTMEYFGSDAIDLRGADAITGFWRKSSEDSGSSEILYVVDSRFTAGPAIVLDIALQVRVSGAYWNVDEPEIELKGRLVTFLRIEEGKVTHHIDFTDYASAMAQIETMRDK